MTGVIKNFRQLAASPERAKLLEILEAGFEAINTTTVINRTVERRDHELRIASEIIDARQYEHIYVVGFGKAAARATEALAAILGELITKGIVIDVNEPTRPLERISFFKGTHPMPSEQNRQATREIINLLEQADEHDLVIIIVSGGGSAFLYFPDEMTYEEEVAICDFLTKAGGNITELNTVRKHLSRARGGNLARHAYPAAVVSLIFSDVPGNDISIIASGPTVLDVTHKDDAAQVLARYGFTGRAALSETPKKSCYFEKVRNIVVLENITALHSMAEKAQALGLKPIILTDGLTGEAREAAQILLKDIQPGQAVLAAGETTVTVTGKGQGGRNQESVLGAVARLQPGDVIASVGSDGWDNGDAAGAIADGQSLARAKALSMDPAHYLAANDSRNFFKPLGDLIITGHTGSNVSDLMCAIRFNH